MRIQLLSAPAHYYTGQPPYRLNPQLGLPILAAVLEWAGHTAQVYDLEALAFTPQRLAAQYDAQRGNWPDAVGFTCNSYNRRGVKDCIAALRGVGYSDYITVGGPWATLRARGSIDEAESWGADSWVAGECEGNVVRLFEERLTGIVQGQPAPIASIPSPLWAKHHPSPMTYGGNLPLGNSAPPQSISMWSRGCPHSCTFCGNVVFGGQKIRRRPVAAVYEDMAALKAMGAKSVFVYDDELLGMPGRAHNGWLTRCCEAIAPLGLAWQCQGRCSAEWIQPDVLAAMAKAGCKAIMWGVESFSQRVLDAMHKGTTEADIWHTLRAAKSAGIGNWLFLMVGNYGETAADLAYTHARLREAMREGLVQWRQVTVCTPMPGTPLYETAAREGWLVEAPETGSQMHQVYQPTPWLSARDIRYWGAQLEAA